MKINTGTEKISRESVAKISLKVSDPPREVRPSALFWLDADVTNEASQTLSSGAPYPVRLAYHWVEEKTREVAVFDGQRSGLSPGLEPHATRRYPMKIVAPATAGKYLLQTTIVQERVSWFEEIRPDVMQEFAVTVIQDAEQDTRNAPGDRGQFVRPAPSEQPMRKGVTIGVPIYRGRPFLEESLSSVQNQTYPDIEVIMSLDGPDPECEEICRRFLSDSRFQLVVQPRQLGWMNHTNWLMAQVATEFWHLQEQDDVLDPSFLATLVQYAIEHPNVAAVFGDVRTFGTLDTHMEMSSVIGSPVTRQMKLIHEHFPGVAPLGLIRTEALRLSGGLPANEFENFAADTAFMAGLARWGELHRVPLELYRKRVHAESTHATWWDWGMDRRFPAWQTHCLDMLRQALLIDATPQDRRLLWLAVVERLVSPRTASYFLPTAELTATDRTDMLDSFLALARASSIDLTGSLDATWDEIESWTRGFSHVASLVPDISSTPGVNLIAYIRAEMGLGTAARGLAHALERANVPFSVINFEHSNPSMHRDTSWRHKEVSHSSYDFTILPINPDNLSNANERARRQFVRDRYTIGYWFWELPEMPDAWLPAFSLVDEVWVASRFVQDAVSMKSPVPVFRVPVAICLGPTDKFSRASFSLPDQQFLFLWMGDMHSELARKNPLGVITAFRQAFPDDNDLAGLVLKINNTDSIHVDREALARIEQAIAGHRNIHLLDSDMTREEVDSLLAVVDCFISLHRSEGFGLGPAEAMSLGKPAILTNWSGNTDYMTPDNSIGIDYKLIPLGQQYGPYPPEQLWADPDLEQAASWMQRLSRDRDLAQKIGKHGQETIKSAFSPEAIGKLILKRLSYLQRTAFSRPPQQL